VYAQAATRYAANTPERADDLRREYISRYIVLTMRQQASLAYLPDIS